MSGKMSHEDLRALLEMTGCGTGNADEIWGLVFDALSLYRWVLGQEHQGNPVHAHFMNGAERGIHPVSGHLKNAEAAQAYFVSRAELLGSPPEPSR